MIPSPGGSQSLAAPSRAQFDGHSCPRNSADSWNEMGCTGVFLGIHAGCRSTAERPDDYGLVGMATVYLGLVN